MSRWWLVVTRGLGRVARCCRLQRPVQFDVLLGGERSQPRNTREVGYKDIPSDTNFSCRIYIISTQAWPDPRIRLATDFHPRSRSSSKK